MRKVIALTETEQRILTARETAVKNNWWITHYMEVEILPKTLISCVTSTEPETGNIFESNNRFYRITKSEKILICPVCGHKANFKIGYRFYCKKHFKHLILTKPNRRAIIQPHRNEPCNCGSGQKFKNCCISKPDQKPRYFFDSRFMKYPIIVKSFEHLVK